MHRETKFLLPRGLQRTDSRRAFRAKKEFTMPVAPIENVPDKKRRRDAEFPHPLQLVLSRSLTVLDSVSRVLPRRDALRLRIRKQDVVDGRVAITMDRDLISGTMVLRHEFHERFAGTQRITAIISLARGL